MNERINPSVILCLGSLRAQSLYFMRFSFSLYKFIPNFSLLSQHCFSPLLCLYLCHWGLGLYHCIQYVTVIPNPRGTQDVNNVSYQLELSLLRALALVPSIPVTELINFYLFFKTPGQEGHKRSAKIFFPLFEEPRFNL